MRNGNINVVSFYAFVKNRLQGYCQISFDIINDDLTQVIYYQPYVGLPHFVIERNGQFVCYHKNKQGIKQFYERLCELKKFEVFYLQLLQLLIKNL